MTPAIQASYHHCATVARREARNFYPSFLLLPADRRRSMCTLYAFMRETDDIADEPASIASKRAALSAWRHDLDQALLGQSAAWPGWPALADAVQRHGIPQQHLAEVIDGVEMDVEPHDFETFEELRGYCYRVASAVGLCCLPIWGFRSEGGLAERLAEDCGLALQLTNIIRDVREDARNGRIYLARDTMARFGVSADDLTAPTLNPPLRDLLAFEADRASRYYERARPLVHLVDPIGRPVLLAIVGIYRALLDEIIRRDYNVLAGRISVARWRKAAIVARAYAGRFAPFDSTGVEAPPPR